MPIPATQQSQQQRHVQRLMEYGSTPTTQSIFELPKLLPSNAKPKQRSALAGFLSKGTHPQHNMV